MARVTTRTRNTVGRPPADVDAGLVERIAREGVPLAGVARALLVSVDTIRRRFSEEFERGKRSCGHGLRAELVDRAMTRNAPGSTPALIFACKSIAGLSEDGPRAEETEEPKTRGIIISAHCPKCGHDPQFGKTPSGDYSRIEDDGTVTDVDADDGDDDDSEAN